MEETIIFSEVLKRKRKEIGWTRKAMTEKMGIPYPTIESWEKGTEPAKYIQRMVLNEMTQHSRMLSKTRLGPNAEAALDKVIASLEDAVFNGEPIDGEWEEGDPEPIPYSVVMEAMKGLPVFVKIRIFAKISEKMEW